MDRHDCWVARRVRGEEEAAFCRLEHIVPWAMRGGAGWGAGEVELVRQRGAHRIVERFESAEQMRIWAQKGGPWQ